MSTVFLIGNGFDINCGLKSSYKDVHAKYITTESSTPIIAKFKNEIASDIDNWGDFEMKLAEYGHYLNCEQELLACVRDFKKFLNEYLLSQQELFIEKCNTSPNTVNFVSQEIINSIKTFFMGITHSLNSLMQNRRAGEIDKVSFITYNYTTVLDIILKNAFIKHIIPEVIHIHGHINRDEPDIIMGIDNEKQINADYELTQKGKRGFVKPIANMEFDNTRVNRARLLLKNADTICVYGMSLGDSDLSWRNYLWDILDNNDEAHIFIYRYELADITGLYDERLDKEDDKKVELFSKWGIEESNHYYDRIHIPCGKNIFNIEAAIKEAEKEIPTVYN